MMSAKDNMTAVNTVARSAVTPKNSKRHTAPVPLMLYLIALVVRRLWRRYQNPLEKSAKIPFPIAGRNV